MTLSQHRYDELPELAEPEKELVPVSGYDSLRVLLVEDNGDYADLVLHSLRHHAPCEFKVDRVTRLGAALERLRNNRYDAILLDLSLPDSDAESTIEKLCSRIWESAIIILSAADDPHLALRAGQMGADDFIRKDQFRTRTLARRIIERVHR